MGVVEILRRLIRTREDRMIIDVHYHFIPAISEQRVRFISKIIVSVARRTGMNIDFEAFIKTAKETWADPTLASILPVFVWWTMLR
jgi:hypothetical protein